MQTWSKDIGTVSLSFGTVRVMGDAAQLWGWAHRPGQSWPCASLTGYGRVCAELDSDGDLVDLVTDGGDSEPDIDGAELTAWIDDNLQGTPYAHLRRGF